MEYPSLKFVFDRKKTATASCKGLVQIEVMSERKRKWIGTGVRLYAGEWHPSKMVVKRLDADILNSNLCEQLASIQNWVNDLRRENLPFDFFKLENFLKKESKAISFIEYLEDRIENRPDIRESTRKSQRKLIGSLKAFGAIVYFQDVTRNNILAYDEWLHRKDYLQSTIHSYHKFLKTYIHDAMRHGVINADPYMGITIDVGRRAVRRFLTKDELSKVEHADMPKEILEKVRDLFVFQCYTGLSYSDTISFDFEKTEERDGRYVLLDTRHKTGSDFYIVLLPKALNILRKYQFKLPVISNQKYNDYLKLVASYAKVNKEITSHMGRHTFATMCLNNGVSIEVLAKMLGHADVKTTAIYAKIINPTVEKAFDELEKRLR